MVGREREHSAQAALQLKLLVVLTERGTELLEHGGVHLPRPMWQRMGKEVGLPMLILDKLIDRWTTDGDDQPAVLSEVSKDRYTLGEAHTREREFLLEGARRSMMQSERGRRGVAQRTAATGKVSL